MTDVMIGPEGIAERVRAIGAEISEEYRGRTPLLVGVLRGAVVFMSDLIRSIDIDIEIDFIAVSSYGGSTSSSGVVRLLKDLDEDISGRHVILVEDVVDTGLTLGYLVRNLRARGPASLEICSLLRKDTPGATPPAVKYVGFDIPDVFVVGYGLDAGERHRELPYISVLDRGH